MAHGLAEVARRFELEAADAGRAGQQVREHSREWRHRAAADVEVRGAAHRHVVAAHAVVQERHLAAEVPRRGAVVGGVGRFLERVAQLAEQPQMVLVVDVGVGRRGAGHRRLR
ncbi:MAG: hypothetical protein FJ301_13675 [Planctomycetes bacterium]|nr:hypothetical protein [Planctomycetota bacterium]